jgi:hypothetical protein
MSHIQNQFHLSELLYISIYVSLFRLFHAVILQAPNVQSSYDQRDLSESFTRTVVLTVLGRPWDECVRLALCLTQSFEGMDHCAWRTKLAEENHLITVARECTQQISIFHHLRSSHTNVLESDRLTTTLVVDPGSLSRHTDSPTEGSQPPYY